MKPMPAALVAAFLASPSIPSAAADPAQIAAKAGCAVCHAADRKIIGPTYKEIAAKYKGNVKALALLSERVRKGSKGVWGPVPMAPNDPARINDADLRAVVGWILTSPG